MDAFYQRLVVGAATIDELLSDDFEPLPGQQGDADLAARRMAAWCQASAAGDWSLFAQRVSVSEIESLRKSNMRRNAAR